MRRECNITLIIGREIFVDGILLLKTVQDPEEFLFLYVKCTLGVHIFAKIVFMDPSYSKYEITEDYIISNTENMTTSSLIYKH